MQRATTAQQAVKTLFDIRRYRWSELFLLIMPSAFILLGMWQLQSIAAHNSGKGSSIITLQSLPTIDTLAPQLLLIVALFATHVVFSWLVPDADSTLLPIAGMLSGMGVLMATRLGPDLPYPSPSLGIKQLVWVLIGIGFCIAIVWLTKNTRWLRVYKYTWAALGVVLVAITLVHARDVNFNSPTHDQLNLGPAGLSFQPSELLKICVVIFFAGYLYDFKDLLFVRKTDKEIEAEQRQKNEEIRTLQTNLSQLQGRQKAQVQARINALQAKEIDDAKRIGPFLVLSPRHLGPLLAMLVISLLMFLVLRELGVALLIFGIFISMIYLASGRLAYVYYSLGGFIGGALIAYELFGYVRDRVAIVSTAFQPGVADNTGYQIVQGLVALGSGGILGQGFGLGHPTFVPAVQTDYVAAAIGNEFGLAGLFAILAIYMLLVYRSFRIAIRGRDTFEQLLAGGIGSIFAIQTLVILAGNLKLMPLTGIPLPFITYGGSSVIANFIMIGFLLRLSAPAESDQI
jgi:cell division protein FtsW (lipid II flippase)